MQSLDVFFARLVILKSLPQYLLTSANSSGICFLLKLERSKINVCELYYAERASFKTMLHHRRPAPRFSTKSHSPLLGVYKFFNKTLHTIIATSLSAAQQKSVPLALHLTICTKRYIAAGVTSLVSSTEVPKSR